MACCMWDYCKIICEDIFSFIARQFPQRSVKSDSHQVQVISQDATWLKGIICRDDTKVSNFLFVFYLLCDKRHLLKRFLWLAIGGSYVRPRASFSGKWCEREHTSVVELSWTMFSQVLCETFWEFVALICLVHFFIIIFF